MSRLESAAKPLPGWLFDRRRRLRWWWLPVLAAVSALVELAVLPVNVVFFLAGDRGVFRRWWRCWRDGSRVMCNGSLEDMEYFTARVFAGEYGPRR